MLASGLVAVNSELYDFLGQPTQSNLVLPQFQGGTTNEGDSSLLYRGSTFSERDSKAALYVQALLLQTMLADRIRVTSPAALQTSAQQQDLTFLFGSRSNAATRLLAAGLDDKKVRFEFGENWAVSCSGQTFAIPDPSRTEAGVYEASDDYGVITKIRVGASSCAFIIAGLGGRATEGSAWHFCHNWKELHQEFGGDNFTVVLKFAAPFAIDRAERVASSRWAGVFPVQ